MSPRAKKTKLTVKFVPLGKKGLFDINGPQSLKSQVSSLKESKHLRLALETRARTGFGYFFALAFTIFLALSALGIGMNGLGFVQETKPLAYAGYDSLKEGIGALKNQDFREAKIWFAKAESSFTDLSDSLRYLTNQANRYLKSPLYLDAANKLIGLGLAGSKIGQGLTSIMAEAQKIPSVFVEQNLKGNSRVRLTDLLRAQKVRLEEVNTEAQKLQQDLVGLNPKTLPAELRQQILKIQEPVSLFLSGLLEIRKNFDTALKLLGDQTPHRYLVLLQNNHELRATGGFIGSYMIVDVNDGAITKTEAKDVYETDGNLLDVVPAPPGIDKVADRLYMRDANYSPDFPTSAKQIMWFLEHSRGPSVDTVIAIDQTVAEKLLGLTGPVTVKSFPFTIRADNFNELFSFHIESKQSETLTPKQLLIDFMPVVKEKLISLNDFAKLGQTMLDLVKSRHIQVYSSDPDVETLAERLNLDGAMVVPAPKTDFLATVTTAIGGNKGDAYIHTQLDHHTTVDQSGRLVDQLTITKTHTWQESDFAGWQKLIDRYGTGKADVKTLKYIQGQGDNIDYLRIYVPKGSKLVSLEGADVTALASSDDLGYTVFALPFGPIPAGKQKALTLTYELPFALDTQKGDIYKFIAQKQAGSENIILKKSLQTSDYLKVVETYPKTENGAFTLYPQFEAALEGNQIFLGAVATGEYLPLK